MKVEIHPGGGRKFDASWALVFPAAGDVEPDHVADLARAPLPFDDGSADVVFFNGSLERLEDPWLAVGEAHRVLRAGGLVRVLAHDAGALLREYCRWVEAGEIGPSLRVAMTGRVARKVYKVKPLLWRVAELLHSERPAEPGASRWPLDAKGLARLLARRGFADVALPGSEESALEELRAPYFSRWMDSGWFFAAEGRKA